jgi:hypothetical protein
METDITGWQAEVAMKRTSRIAIRLGLDGNPLRRRIDKISVLSTAGLLAVFLAAAPVASVAVAHAVTGAATAEQHDERTWRQVEAVLTQGAVVPPGEYNGGYDSWTWARWTTPAGHPMDGVIAAPSGARAGTRVPIWITPSGQWGGMPLSHASAQLRVVLAIIGTTIMLALALACASAAFRRRLDRRRLAGWEASWDAVGPQWTQQFRTRGL